MKLRVAIVKTDIGLEEATLKAIKLLGNINHLIGSYDNVLLKPNLFTNKGAETGATTDMRIVLTVAKLLKENGYKSILGECPAMASYARPEVVFEELGVRRLCEEKGVELKILDRDRPVKVEVEGVIKKEFWYPETSTLNPIISFPKLKTHALTTLTCAVKNLFGLQQGGTKANHHVSVANDAESFSHLLLDIYMGIQDNVKLNVVDAHVAMEGEGPTTGEPVDLGLIIAGVNAVAVDMVASAVMGWNPMDVGTNYLASLRGLGPHDLSEIEVLGEQVDRVNRLFRKPQIASDKEQFYRIRMPLVCDAGKCKSCGICEKVCPGKAITLYDIPEFDMEKCIQCFCCMELCPNGAIRAIRSHE